MYEKYVFSLWVIKKEGKALLFYFFED